MGLVAQGMCPFLKTRAKGPTVFPELLGLLGKSEEWGPWDHAPVCAPAGDKNLAGVCPLPAARNLPRVLWVWVWALGG